MKVTRPNGSLGWTGLEPMAGLGEEERATGFGGRSTKDLTAQKLKDRLDSQNNPEGFFCSGRLYIWLCKPDVTCSFCAARS